MRKIALYPDGSAGVINTDSNTVVSISGQQPSEYLEPTQENMDKYFPNLKEVPQASKIKLK